MEQHRTEQKVLKSEVAITAVKRPFLSFLRAATRIKEHHAQKKGNHRDVKLIRIGQRLCVDDVEGTGADVPRAVFHVGEEGGDVGGVGVELRPLRRLYWQFARMNKPLGFGVPYDVRVHAARHRRVRLPGRIAVLIDMAHAEAGVASFDPVSNTRGSVVALSWAALPWCWGRRRRTVRWWLCRGRFRGWLLCMRRGREEC